MASEPGVIRPHTSQTGGIPSWERDPLTREQAWPVLFDLALPERIVRRPSLGELDPPKGRWVVISSAGKSESAP